MALALRLFLPLLLAAALPARAAQAAPLQVRGADEHARKASPAAWLHADFQPLKPPAGVSAGRTFPGPLVNVAHNPESHRREMDREAVVKAEFPGGSSGSLAASAAGREAMPGPVTGGWDHDLHHLERLANHGLRFLELGEAERDDEDDLDSQPIPITEPQGDAEGVSAGRTFPGPLVDVAHKPHSHRRDAAGTSTHADKTWKSMRRVFCWGTPCLVKLMAIVLGAALCLMICSAGIWYCWKRKWCSCPSSEDNPNNSGKENLIRPPSSSLLSPSALPQLQHPLEPFPKLTPPQRNPPSLSPLVLFPSYD
ncbi:uncharacterized protein LOC128783355 isoform X6 [Vidua chalybeata]|uniref:uncharacterized protein LOC128783355 isoform X6 n=1 Tax=Vidua chalybeata TaxID=81927 RepID=UPI0023A79743|nr:uncharacterized protein LOC128783355 isoform X6 [Vidua chalybeata]